MRLRLRPFAGATDGRSVEDAVGDQHRFLAGAEQLAQLLLGGGEVALGLFLGFAKGGDLLGKIFGRGSLIGDGLAQVIGGSRDGRLRLGRFSTIALRCRNPR